MTSKNEMMIKNQVAMMMKKKTEGLVVTMMTKTMVGEEGLGMKMIIMTMTAGVGDVIGEMTT